MRLDLMLVFCALCACSSPGGPSADTPARPTSAATLPQATETLARLAALGEAAAVVVALDPQGWPQLHGHLEAFADPLPPEARAELAAAKTPPALLAAIGRRAGRLAHWDPARVTVAALFEPAVGGPPGSLATLLPMGSGSTPGFRHEAVLPATDAAKLEAELRSALEQMADAEGDGYRAGDAWLSLKAHGDAVRVVAFTHAARAAPPPGRVWREIAPATPTAGLQALASRSGALAIMGRPAPLRGVFGQMGLYQAVEALDMVDGAHRAMLTAKAIELVLGAGLAMSAAHPEFDDHALLIGADATGIALEGTSSLTPAGADAMAAGAKGAGVVWPVSGAPLAQGVIRFDLDAALGVATPADVFGRPGVSLRRLGRAFSECGSGCPLHALTRTPLGTLRGLRDLLPSDARAFTRSPPRAIQFAVLGLEPPQIAVVADVPRDQDLAPLRAALQRTPMTLHLSPAGDRAALLLGLGVDPRTVFDLKGSAELQGLSSWRADPGQIAAAIAREAPPVARALGRLERVTLDAQLADRVLGWRLHLAAKGATAPGWAPRAARPWRSPPGDPVTKAVGCLRRTLEGVQEAFGAIGHAAPEMRPELLEAALGELEGSLSCAEADASTRPAAAGVRRQIQALAKEGREAAAKAKADEEAARKAAEDALAKHKAIEAATALKRVVGDAPPSGSLDKDAIARVIKRHRASFRYCYQKSLVKQPQLAGKVVIGFTIQPDGRATALKTGEDTLKTPEVVTCLHAAFERLRFPPPEGGKTVRVSYPFIFDVAD